MQITPAGQIWPGLAIFGQRRKTTHIQWVGHGSDGQAQECRGTASAIARCWFSAQSVFVPFLVGFKTGLQAANFSFIACVKPPMATLGRSLLNVWPARGVILCLLNRFEYVTARPGSVPVCRFSSAFLCSMRRAGRKAPILLFPLSHIRRASGNAVGMLAHKNINAH